jgi:hypothetical protein
MTITLTREEAQQVLDVLNDVRYRIEFGQMNLSDDTDAAIETLRARLAQPEPEPVAWMMLENKLVPIHTAPPQREWQGLTDEEVHNTVEYVEDRALFRFARAIEAKLKEKNT